MWRRVAPIVFLAASCGDDKNGDPGLPDLIQVYVGPDAASVSIATRVQATIDRDDAEQCRFVMADTDLTITRGGAAVDGAVVFFIDGLRIDFTPSGLFEYGTTYEYEVSTPCAKTVTGSFTTVAVPAGSPTVAVGDAFRVESMAISEPQAIAPLLRGFLEDANLVMKVMAFDDSTIEVLGGEGDDMPFVPTWPDQSLKIYNENAFLFPMEGVFKWPYVQSVGSLGIPVDVPGGEESTIDLEYFEISGQLFGTSPETEMVAGVIRASSPCDQVCEVQDADLQLVCANRASICDAAGMLNLVGSFEAPSNNLSFSPDGGTTDPFQQFLTRVPAPGATGVAVDTTVSVTLSRAVNATKDGAVSFYVTDPSGNEVAGTTDFDDTSGTFTPGAALTANTTYTVLVVALDATEWLFTTAP